MKMKNIRPFVESMLNEYKDSLKRMKERKDIFLDNNNLFEYCEQKGSIKTLECVIKEIETMLILYNDNKEFQ